MPNRRAVLTTLTAAALLPLQGRTARAQPVQHKIGAAQLTVFSDGAMSVPPDRLIAKAPADAGAAMLARLEATGGTTFAINVPLIEIGGKRILVDSGGGGTFMASAGKLADNLAAANIDLASIDLVVLTHAHPDHIGGLIDDLDDSLRFPNARYAISTAEHAFWTGAAAASTQGVGEGTLLGARRVLKAIDAKLDRVAAAAEIAPGVAFVDASGHTPGQCAVLIKSGTEAALVAADTVFHPVVSVEHPDWQPAQDMDGDKASAARRRVLDIAAAEKAVLTAYHVRTGVGRIERAGAGFKWVAV